MKKLIGVCLVLGLMISVNGYTAQRGTAEYEKLKEYKRQQRENKPKKQAEPANPNHFWSKEGERSGLNQAGARFSGFWKKMNPAPYFSEQQKKYNERKIAQGSSQGSMK